MSNNQDSAQTRGKPVYWGDWPLIHICEVCGKTEVMRPSEAFLAGWDYPPRMGSFSVISPRICGDCCMNKTLWWALVHEKKSVGDLNDSQRETFKRVLGEPASIIPMDIDSPVFETTEEAFAYLEALVTPGYIQPIP